jgi:hypothetical protein
MKTQLIVGGVCLLVGGFLGAYSGTWLESRRNAERNVVAAEATAARISRIEAEMGQLKQHVELLHLHLALGRIALEADRQDYGTAAAGATAFYDDLSQVAEQAKDDGEMYAALQQVLATRDDIIAGLATVDPAATQRLKQLYLEFFEAVY